MYVDILLRYTCIHFLKCQKGITNNKNKRHDDDDDVVHSMMMMMIRINKNNENEIINKTKSEPAPTLYTHTRAHTSHSKIKSKVTGKKQRYRVTWDREKRAPETRKHTLNCPSKRPQMPSASCICGSGDYVIRIHLRSLNSNAYITFFLILFKFRSPFALFVYILQFRQWLNVNEEIKIIIWTSSDRRRHSAFYLTRFQSVCFSFYFTLLHSKVKWYVCKVFIFCLFAMFFSSKFEISRWMWICRCFLCSFIQS